MSDNPVKKALRSLQLGNNIVAVLGDIVIERCGFRKGWQVLMYVTVWGIFKERNGRPPVTVRELAAGIGTEVYDFSTIARWRRAFVAAFPEFDTPELLWEQVAPSALSESVEVAAMQVASAEVLVSA